MNIFEDWCLAKILGKSGPGPFQEINLDNIVNKNFSYRFEKYLFFFSLNLKIEKIIGNLYIPKILISLIFYE